MFAQCVVNLFPIHWWFLNVHLGYGIVVGSKGLILFHVWLTAQLPKLTGNVPKIVVVELRLHWQLPNAVWALFQLFCCFWLNYSKCYVVFGEEVFESCCV